MFLWLENPVADEFEEPVGKQIITLGLKSKAYVEFCLSIFPASLVEILHSLHISTHGWVAQSKGEPLVHSFVTNSAKDTLLQLVP